MSSWTRLTSRLTRKTNRSRDIRLSPKVDLVEATLRLEKGTQPWEKTSWSKPTSQKMTQRVEALCTHMIMPWWVALWQREQEATALIWVTTSSTKSIRKRQTHLKQGQLMRGKWANQALNWGTTFSTGWTSNLIMKGIHRHHRSNSSKTKRGQPHWVMPSWRGSISSKMKMPRVATQT